MAGAIMNKVWDFLGVDTANDEEVENDNENIYGYEREEEPEEVEEKGLFGRKSKVVSMPQPQQIKMVITQPTSFEQSEEICNYLKEKKSIIVNLEYVNKDVARRIVDFISGGVHALDGHIQKVSNAIFLVAPVNYEIASDLAREEIKNKLSVSWLKNNN
ncbi:MAG: cell division protein SepF [Clostridia bacterium]|jgi:cell division protein sepF|nr:cell division protein sepF [Clostridium sp. CAG:452]HJJ03278.1 cell division protein SepF [Clostridiaceae bacterium]